MSLITIILSSSGHLTESMPGPAVEDLELIQPECDPAVAGLARCWNQGAPSACGAWLGFLTPGVSPLPHFAVALAPLLREGHYYLPPPGCRDLVGNLLLSRIDFQRAGGFDELLGNAATVADLVARLQMAGLKPLHFPGGLLERGGAVTDGEASPVSLADALYSRAKLDMVKLTEASVTPEVNRALHGECSRISRDLAAGHPEGKLELGLGPHGLGTGDWILQPRLVYSLRPAPVASPVELTPRPPMPFIVGSGRCGTTLLRLMLDNHPDMAIPYETHFIPDLAASWSTAPDPMVMAWLRIVNDPRWPSYGIDAREFRHALGEARPASLGMALRVFFDLCRQRHGKLRAGNKTANYVWAMETIAAHLPEARFIHLVRDGRDVALSFRGLWWGPQTLAEAAAWWVASLETARAFSDSARYLEVRYEDLVRDPEPTLRRICEFIELPWSDALLNHATIAAKRLDDIGDMPMADGRTIDAERIRAIHIKTRGPLDPSGIGRWQADLSSEERQQFATLAGPMLASLGYAP